MLGTAVGEGCRVTNKTAVAPALLDLLVYYRRFRGTFPSQVVEEVPELQGEGC